MFVGTRCECSPLTTDPSLALERGDRYPSSVSRNQDFGHYCSQSARPKLLIDLPAQAHDNFWKRFDVLQRSAKVHNAETQREFVA